MDMMTALGVYVTQCRIAHVAARRRFALLTVLASDLRRAAQSATAPPGDAVRARITEAEELHRQMREAIEAANEVAADCREPALSVARMLRDLDEGRP